MAPKKTVSFRVDEDLWAEVGRKVEAEGINVTTVITRFLEQYVDSEPEPPITERLADLEAEVRALKGKLLSSQFTHSEQPTNRYAAKNLSDLLPSPQAG